MHKLTKTGLLAAVFACVSVGSAAENEWSTPLGAALVKPGEKAPTATDCSIGSTIVKSIVCSYR